VTRKEILDTASTLVSGDRHEQHGDAKENFGTIGQLWQAYLGTPVSAYDVAMMMTLFKVGRAKTGSMNDDNFIDAAGYIAIGGEIGK
jgi:hypothetical protein